MNVSPLVVAVGLVLPACSSPTASSPVPEPSCTAGLALPNGDCIAPGQRAEDCGSGFRFDGVDTCYPVLPPESCASGLMAVPGEEICRPVAPCPSEHFGEAERLAGAVFVDGNYGGADSDGSAARPWTRIQDAVNAAPDGSVIGIAAGSYGESVTIVGKSVQLIGRCPEMVEIVGRASGVAAVFIPQSGAGSRVSMLTVTGAGEAGIVTSAPSTTFDRLWIHDLPVMGLVVQSPTIKASALASDILVERVSRRGIYALGGVIDVSRASVRDVELADGGAGIGAHTNPSGETASIRVTQSVVERTGGIATESALLELDGVAVLDVRARPGNDVTPAIGVGGTSSHPASAVVDRSYVAHVDGVGAYVIDGQLRMSRTTVRDVYDASSINGGLGIFIDARGGPLPEVTLERVVVHSTVDTSVVHQGGRLNISGSVLRDVAEPVDGRTTGIGLAVVDAHPPALASTRINRSLIERVPDSGILVHGTDVTVEDSVIRGVYGPPDAIADGLSVRRFEDVVPSTLVRNVLLRDNGRAGVTAAGGQLIMEGVSLECNGGPDVNGETFMATNFDISFDETTRCGCPHAENTCRVTTLGIF